MPKLGEGGAGCEGVAGLVAEGGPVVLQRLVVLPEDAVAEGLTHETKKHTNNV